MTWFRLHCSARLIFGGNVHIHSARVDVLPDGQVHYVSNRYECCRNIDADALARVAASSTYCTCIHSIAVLLAAYSAHWDWLSLEGIKFIVRQ